MDRNARSTRPRGQTTDNERYGPSARTRNQSHNNDDYNTYTRDDSSSDDEFGPARDNHHSDHWLPLTDRRERPRRPAPMNRVSDYDDDAIRRRAAYQPRRVGDADDVYTAQMRDRDTYEGVAGRHDTRVREGVHHPNCPARHEMLRRGEYSDSESESEMEIEPERRRGPGMATREGLGRGGGRGVEFGSRYGSTRGPRDHVRGPRRTGDRVDFDDDSEDDEVFDVGHRGRRRF